MALKANHAAALDTVVALLRVDLNDLPEDSIAVQRELRNVRVLQETDALAIVCWRNWINLR